MADQTPLMRRAEALYTDLQAAIAAEPESLAKQLMEKALPMSITVYLLLKGTTEEFRAEMVAKGPW